MRDIKEWLQNAYGRVVKQRPKERKDRGYAAAPAGARPTNRLSRRASFASCVHRRIGYIAHVEAAELAALKLPEHQSPERVAWMEDAWHRGVTWMPLLIEAAVEDERWVIKRIKDYDVAHFLAGRQKMVVVQVFEKDRASGTNEKLALLKAGLFTKEGKRCPVIFARVTY